MKHGRSHQPNISTALLLAAGKGSRLFPLTEEEPKCLTMVNGRSILERLLSNLNQHGFERLVIVTGHLENSIREYLGNQVGEIAIDYVFSPSHGSTNNIYSLWMAREVINEPFLLLESDLVFEASLLSPMLQPDRIAIAKMQPWMNGTYVTVNRSHRVRALLTGSAESNGEARYKTVNIYSLSLPSWRGILDRLNRYISEGRVNEFYEAAFADMIADGHLSLDTVSFDGRPWYEIDTLEDLAKAEKLFSSDIGQQKRVTALSHIEAFGDQLTNAIASRQEETGILNATE